MFVGGAIWWINHIRRHWGAFHFLIKLSWECWGLPSSSTFPYNGNWQRELVHWATNPIFSWNCTWQQSSFSHQIRTLASIKNTALSFNHPLPSTPLGQPLVKRNIAFFWVDCKHGNINDSPLNTLAIPHFHKPWYLPRFANHPCSSEFHALGIRFLVTRLETSKCCSCYNLHITFQDQLKNV